VTLNLRGFTLTGPGASADEGIRVTAGQSRTVIANGTVTAFDDGIFLEPPTTDVVITLMRLLANDSRGARSIRVGP
jgi:hypothetical protein